MAGRNLLPELAFQDKEESKGRNLLPMEKKYGFMGYSPEGFTGVAGDVAEGVFNTPGAYASSLGTLGKGLGQLVLSDPEWAKEFGTMAPELTGYNKKQIFPTAGAAVTTGLQKLGQVPTNASDYIMEKFYPNAKAENEYIREWTKKHENQTGKKGLLTNIEEMVTAANPENMDWYKQFGSDISQPANQLIAGPLEQLPASLLMPGGPLAKFLGGAAANAIGGNENPITAALTALGLAKTPAAIKATAKPVKWAGEKAGKIMEQRGLKKEITNTEKEMLDLENQSKTELPKEFSDIISQHANTSKNSARIELSDVAKGFYETQNKISENNYNSLRNSEAGRRHANIESLQLEKIGEAELTLDAQDMLTGIEKNPTISSLVDLNKQLKEDAFSLSQDATKATTNERNAIQARRKKIDELQGKVENTIKESLSPEEFAKLKEADTFYRTHVLPFRQDKVLKNLKDKGELLKASILPHLSGKGHAALRKTMLQDRAVADAMLNYDLAGKRIASIKDARKVINENVIDALEINSRMKAREAMNKWESNEAMIAETKVRMEKMGLKDKEIEHETAYLKGLLKHGAYFAAAKYSLGFLVKGLK